MYNRVELETGLGHPGNSDHLGHVLSESSGSNQLYKISGSGPDSTLDHVHI